MNNYSFYDQLQTLEPKKDEFSKEERLKAMEKPLLSWYKNHARVLPWRENPEPYRVWISEIMLQQTRVEAVKPYFERFMAALPDTAALAAVPEDRLFKLWEGLGYYNRARNLKKAAGVVMEQYGGVIPASWEALKTLPGIGSYTAGAIASIAYGIPVPAVDGNVLRVISRVTGSREDILKQSVKKQMEELLLGVMPQEEAGSYNQALIETPKKSRKIEEKTILILEWEGRTAIRKRDSSGLLASLYELPGVEGWLEDEALAQMYRVPLAAVRRLPEAKHIFSHVEWRMRGFAVELQEKPTGDYLWVTPEEIRETYSLPSAFKAYTMMIR